MNDRTVEWKKERYDQIVGKLAPFLKRSGFRLRDLKFIPIAGISGDNVLNPVTPEVCPWYSGPSLIQILEEIPLPKRDEGAPLRVPVLDRMKDAGKLIIQGKVESGVIRLGDKVVVVPGKKGGKITALANDVKDLRVARPGEHIRFTIHGLHEEHVRQGNVVCSENNVITPVPQFEAQLMVLDLLTHKPVFSPGYSAVLHCHTIMEECTVKSLLYEVDRKTNTPGKKKPKFVKKGEMVVCRLEVQHPVAVELFKDYPQLGRFTLRDEGKTIAIGTITRLPQQRKPEGI